MKVVAVIVFLLFLHSVAATASTPPINNWSISSTSPTIAQTVVIRIDMVMTDEFGTAYNTAGISATLYWSRDKIIYETQSMTLITSSQYETSIPPQDGSYSAAYDAGAGVMYWYLVIANVMHEETRLFSASNPNADIVYRDISDITSSTPTVTPPHSNIILGIPVPSVDDVLSDPLTQITVIALFILVVVLFAQKK